MFPISIFLKCWSKVQRVCYLCWFVPMRLETSLTHPVLLTDRISMTPRFCSAHARLERKHKKSRRKTKDLLFPSGRFQPARTEITNWLSGAKKKTVCCRSARAQLRKKNKSKLSFSRCPSVWSWREWHQKKNRISFSQCLFCFLEQESNEMKERNSVDRFCCISKVFLFVYQHPAGTSAMKSNSFWPSQSSGSSFARSKPNSTTSDMRTSSSTGSKSIIPPAPELWLPMLMPTPIPPPPRPPDGPRSWFPVPRGEVPKPLWAPPGAGCPAEAPARFW